MMWIAKISFTLASDLEQADTAHIRKEGSVEGAIRKIEMSEITRAELHMQELKSIHKKVPMSLNLRWVQFKVSPSATDRPAR